MDKALTGEGPPPLELRKYILAAGMGEIHGLGAAAVYGPHPLLRYREFETAWAIQQAMARHAENPEETKKQVSIRRTLDLEKQGYLDVDSAEAVRPDWLPLDPGPM